MIMERFKALVRWRGQRLGPFLRGASLGLWGLLAVPLTAQSPSAGTSTVPVEVAEARREMMAPVGWVSGTVVSRDDARVAAEGAGRLTWVAELGDQIKRGAVLARIEKKPLELRLRRDEANIRRLEARIKYLHQQLTRLETLIAEQITAQARLDELRAESEMAEQDLELAKVARDETLDQLARTEIRAPFPGQVVERVHQPGEYIGPGVVVARLVNVARPEVRAQASPDAVPHLRQGMPLTVRLDERQVEGQLRAVVPVGDNRSRLFEVRVRLPEASAGSTPWLVGTAVRLALPDGAARDAITVPRDALVLRQGATWIFRVTAESVVERIAVETGAARGERVEVHGEISAGDLVVVRGAERLQPGQVVTVGAAS